jgi:hypothetical protein
MFWVHAHGSKARHILNLLLLIGAVPYEHISWQWLQSIMIWFCCGISGITWSPTIHGLWRRPEVVDCLSLSKVHTSAYEYKGWRAFGSDSQLSLVSQWPLCSTVSCYWFVVHFNPIGSWAPTMSWSYDADIPRFCSFGGIIKAVCCLSHVSISGMYRNSFADWVSQLAWNFLRGLLGQSMIQWLNCGLSPVYNLTMQNAWVVGLSCHDQWCLQTYSYNTIFMKCPQSAVLCDCVYIHIVWSILQVIRSRLQVLFFLTDSCYYTWLGIHRHWQQFMIQLTEIE